MMTNKEKYKQAFGVLHASENISLEVNKGMNKNKVFSPGIKLVTACMCVAILLSASLTVYAAYHFLSPSQVASEIYDNSSIAEAFEGEKAIQINESVESNGYVITLLGMTSGTGLVKYFDDAGNQIEIERSETYAVIAFENADGTPMPKTSDENYDMNNILVTPFIGGQEPWKVNIYTLGGGYTEITRDGIAYRLISCKNLNMFADRGVYIGVCQGLSEVEQGFYLNTQSGAIDRNENYDGLNVLFRLPLDESKADHSEAEQFLEQILNPVEDNSSDEISDEMVDYNSSMPEDLKEWDQWLRMGMPGNDVARRCNLLEGSEVNVEADEEGEYKLYRDGNLAAYIEREFLDTSGDIQVLSWSSADTLESLEILTYVYNEDGTVTFAIYTPYTENAKRN